MGTRQCLYHLCQHPGLQRSSTWAPYTGTLWQAETSIASNACSD